MAQFLNSVDFNEVDSKEQTVERVSEFPESPKVGRMVFKEPENCLNVYNGTEWISMCSTPAEPTIPENVLVTEDGTPISLETVFIVSD